MAMPLNWPALGCQIFVDDNARHFYSYTVDPFFTQLCAQLNF